MKGSYSKPSVYIDIKEDVAAKMPHLTNYNFYCISAFVFVALHFMLGHFIDEYLGSAMKRNGFVFFFANIWCGMASHFSFTMIMIQVWLTFKVLAISFLEAWKKFDATTLDKKVGLDVGRTVFHSLNRAEIVLNFTLLFFFLHKHSWKVFNMVFPFASITACIFLDVMWLQPTLDLR